MLVVDTVTVVVDTVVVVVVVTVVVFVVTVIVVDTAIVVDSVTVVDGTASVAGHGPTCGSHFLELVCSGLEDGLSLLGADGLLHGGCALVPPQGLQVQVLVRVHPCTPT